ncbi:LuxR C-terminal-related transcriptional regulator [Methylobacterium sp. V23]|uniref:helix-turn-helix transcriptional regulator n=1 Tax=Methylobacterium sp. V23 TaxID=2044878 RepID=UPI000CDAA09A|nr:LuxR C-terminal-related transcriptional regulator [Methylobacterium sp. V23]POR39927.1 helix-turn-helix transcriptional regulator [Methylobacterium sp. V23]
MISSLAVCFVGETASIDTALQTTLKQLSTIQLIPEAELERDEPRSKAALFFVQEAEIASAVARVTALKKQLPSLRIVVGIQAMSATNLRQLVEAGADSFVTRRPSLDDLRAALMPHGEDLPSNGETAPVVATEPLDLDLTRRETEILRLLSSGFSNKDVARRLDVSVRTVESHRLILRRKTQTGRLKDLIALARTLNLAPVLDVTPPETHRFAGQDTPVVSEDSAAPKHCRK